MTEPYTSFEHCETSKLRGISLLRVMSLPWKTTIGISNCEIWWARCFLVSLFLFLQIHCHRTDEEGVSCIWLPRDELAFANVKLQLNLSSTVVLYIRLMSNTHLWTHNFNYNVSLVLTSWKLLSTKNCRTYILYQKKRNKPQYSSSPLSTPEVILCADV